VSSGATMHGQRAEPIDMLQIVSALHREGGMAAAAEKATLSGRAAHAEASAQTASTILVLALDAGTELALDLDLEGLRLLLQQAGWRSTCRLR